MGRWSLAVAPPGRPMGDSGLGHGPAAGVGRGAGDAKAATGGRGGHDSWPGDASAGGDGSWWLVWPALGRRAWPGPARPTRRAHAAPDRGSAGRQRRPAAFASQAPRAWSTAEGPALQGPSRHVGGHTATGAQPARTALGRSLVVRILAGLGDGDSNQLLAVPRGPRPHDGGRQGSR